MKNLFKDNLNFAINKPKFKIRKMTRTVKIFCNNNIVKVGGNNPVIIQSMTNTDTCKINETVIQIVKLVKSGSELVRITVNNYDSAKAVPLIREKLDRMGINVPLIGDFHFNGHKILNKFSCCAKSLSKYRINPGNVGINTESKNKNFKKMIEMACMYDKPVRIGVNWGSMDKDFLANEMNRNKKLSIPLNYKDVMINSLVFLAIENAKRAEKIGLPGNKIVISCKVSRVQDLIKIYKNLSENCNYPLHLGLTESGIGIKSIVSSTAALSILLQYGIGDTIRVSTTPGLNDERSNEVIICKEILQTMGLRKFSPNIVSCPGCGRTSNKFFQMLAKKVQINIKNQMKIWSLIYPGIESMNIAVMGCIVNGPGESCHSDIGISLPGNGENISAPVYIDGRRITTLKGNFILNDFINIIESYIINKWSKNIKQF